jgi:anti-anti-sigma factor
MIRVEGYFDEESAARVETETASLTAGSGLVLDLAAVSYLSSSGVGELVHLSSRFALALAAPSETVRKVLALAEVLPVFDVCATREEAAACSRAKC